MNKLIIFLITLSIFSTAFAEDYYAYTIKSLDDNSIDLTIDPTITDGSNMSGQINGYQIKGLMDPHVGMPQFRFVSEERGTIDVVCNNDNGFICTYTMPNKEVRTLKFMGMDPKKFTIYFNYADEIIPIYIEHDYFQSNHFYEAPILHATIENTTIRYQVSKPICWGLASHTSFLALGGYLVTK